MDKIFIRDLLARGIIGVDVDERKKPQDILINVELVIDLRRACISDNIDDTVSYSAVTKAILSLVESAKCYTVEALAEKIASLLFEYPLITQVSIRVEKPNAVRFTRSVGVEIERSRIATD
jgi:FolB domain-containing protein